MKATKTVTIDKRFLLSIPFGIIIGLLFTSLLHLFGIWQTSYEEPNGKESIFTFTPKIKGYINKWSISEDFHYNKLDTLLPQENKEEAESTLSSFKIENSFTNIFDQHFAFITLFSVIGTLIVYMFKRINFKIV